jgi:8-oxo-dGTP diphosphatase
MKKTTLCYIENNGRYLMLYRNRKPDDPNEGKWLGIGGKIEDGESPDECNMREVLEETGLRLKSFVFHGVIEFRSDTWDDEDMYLYSSSDFVPADEEAARVFRETGEYALPECDEGELAWVESDKLLALPMWEGDRIFLRLLDEDTPFFSLKLTYRGDTLLEAVLNGKIIQ